jgi:hypothetical protein
MLDLVFTGDGRFVLTAGWDNTIRVWDVQRRELIRAFADHQRPVYSVDVSTDGDLAASASRDGTVRLWELSGVSDFEQQRELAAAASKSLQSQPGNPELLVSMAKWYVARGAEPLALRLLSDAAAAGARVSNLQRARCYVALEMWSDAQRHYELAAVASEAPAEYLRACLLAVAARIENRASTFPQSRLSLHCPARAAPRLEFADVRANDTVNICRVAEPDRGSTGGRLLQRHCARGGNRGVRPGIARAHRARL